MSTAILEKPPASNTSPAAHTATLPLRTPSTTAKSKTIMLGFDLGTNKSCILAGAPSGSDIVVSKVVPTVVGYVKDGIVDGIIAGNAQKIFGEDALRNMLHVRLVAPVAEGVIADHNAVRDFLQYLRSLVDPAGTAEIRAVIGMPANAVPQAREDIRRCSYGIFDRVILIPEPFLAALGYRDDSRVSQPNYLDPVVNSLFIDIGGGTSDLSLVQGCFPTSQDQISIPFAGDAIDELPGAAAAVGAIQATRYDIVFMDWYMPEMNGAALLEVIRDRRFAGNWQVPIVMMTAYPNRETIARAKELGANEVLTKPFSQAHAAAALGRLLPDGWQIPEEPGAGQVLL
ncbi:MAG: response regulator [Verrucomicrobiota bacterium]